MKTENYDPKQPRNEDGRWSPSSVSVSREDRPNNFIKFNVSVGDKNVGYLTVKVWPVQKEVVVKQIDVHEDYRRGGLASRLHEEAFRHAESLGYTYQSDAGLMRSQAAEGYWKKQVAAGRAVEDGGVYKMLPTTNAEPTFNGEPRTADDDRDDEANLRNFYARNPRARRRFVGGNDDAQAFSGPAAKEDATENYDPHQPRNDEGQWTDGGVTGRPSVEAVVAKMTAMYKKTGRPMDGGDCGAVARALEVINPLFKPYAIIDSQKAIAHLLVSANGGKTFVDGQGERSRSEIEKHIKPKGGALHEAKYVKDSSRTGGHYKSPASPEEFECGPHAKVMGWFSEDIDA